MRGSMVLCAILMVGCKALPEAERSFSDALVDALRDFYAPEEEMAAMLRAVERNTYGTIDLGAKSVNERAVAPTPLTEADVADLERPDVDPGTAMAVAVAGLSAFELEAHATIPTMPDQKPVEPQSPDHYERHFLEGRDCWEGRGCAVLKTRQDVTKKNALLEVPYEFFKDFRWVDMNAGLPGAEPRWAYVAKSWNPDSFTGVRGNNTLVQSYTVEFWFPRDGRGFLWEEEEALEQGDLVEDSDGAGALRLLSLWTETDLSIAAGDDIVMGTIRYGIEQNFEAVEDFLGND